jgi:hypothetical protein
MEPRRDANFGFTQAEALGCSLDIIIPERLRERHWQGYRATMRTGQTRYGDGQVLSYERTAHASLWSSPLCHLPTMPGR